MQTSPFSLIRLTPANDFITYDRCYITYTMCVYSSTDLAKAEHFFFESSDKRLTSSRPARWRCGKGACDGVGGTVKRLAARASLQRPYDQQIMTPRQLFDWAAGKVPAVFFQYCSLR